MEAAIAGRPRSPNQSRSHRALAVAAPLACGCLVAAAASYVALSDPLGQGSTLLPCPLYQTTGLWCPACGLTRATHALLNGDVPAAIGYNMLFPLFLAAIVIGWTSWLRSALGRAPMRFIASMRTGTVVLSGVMIGVLVLAFGVLRNMPGLEALAP